MSYTKPDNLVPKYWYNIIPFLKDSLSLEIPPLLDPDSGQPMEWKKLAQTLPAELAKQELGIDAYGTESRITVPDEVFKFYCTYRPTPLIRASKLEKALGLEKVKLFYKREDYNSIGSYKLNSSYAQAYYAKQEGVKELVCDTGPGNWGLGMALACKEFSIPITIYMEKKNYESKIEKVRAMEKLGAKVVPIVTEQGTIAASISVALEHVGRDPKNKLSLGCLSAYSALHNTVIGLELKEQLDKESVTPDALIGVVGGGSSFSGLVFPFLESHGNKTEFIAVESTSVPSFTQGEYRYENPDLVKLMPKAKMYTLGNTFVPKNLGASGLNYHGKNPLLSLLVNKGFIKAVSYSNEEVDALQKLFEETEGIKPAPESCYAIKGAIEKARVWNGQDKNIIFSLTGNAQSLDL